MGFYLVFIELCWGVTDSHEWFIGIRIVFGLIFGGFSYFG